MLNYRKMTKPVLLTAALLMGSLALAADAVKKPSGTVTIDETQFGFIVGGSSGGGSYGGGGSSSGGSSTGGGSRR